MERWSDAWPRYAVELGGQWNSGGLNIGFSPAQLHYANGGRVEILQPWHPEDNPFLRRFLDRHGPGPHHLTFKVPDLASAIEDARQAGFTPVGVDLSNDDWKEAFLHPRQATGIVVQMAQASHLWQSPPPEGFPAVRPERAASLVRVTHAVAELDTGLALFEGLLGGRRTGQGVAPDESWACVDLRWAGPLAVRVVGGGGGRTITAGRLAGPVAGPAAPSGLRGAETKRRSPTVPGHRRAVSRGGPWRREGRVGHRSCGQPGHAPRAVQPRVGTDPWAGLEPSWRGGSTPAPALTWCAR